MNPYKDSRVTSPLKKRFVHFLVATHRDLHMLSQGNRNYSLNAGHVGNEPKIRIRRPSRKMNESFLFSLATSAEPMQVTWKMNDERDLICIRQMNESSRSPPDRVFVSMNDREVNDSFICRIQIFGSMFRSSANRVFGSMIRSSAGYGSLDHFSRDLHRLRRGNRKDLFTSFTFAWLGLVRRELYPFTSNNYRFRYLNFCVLYLGFSVIV